jgi:hypothetical protein
MNAADLAGSGSLFSAVQGHGLAGNNLGMESMISPSMKMIPVQGFPSAQPSLQQTNQLQQQIQRTGLHQNVMYNPRGQQQPQQPQQLPQQQQRQIQQLARPQQIYESQQSSGLAGPRQSGVSLLKPVLFISVYVLVLQILAAECL